jgi:hypothetical protein
MRRKPNNLFGPAIALCRRTVKASTQVVVSAVKDSVRLATDVMAVLLVATWSRVGTPPSQPTVPRDIA